MKPKQTTGGSVFLDAKNISIKEISKSEYEVGVINSIKHAYPHLRQRSKIP
jgi:hypothetical protein